MRLLIGLTVAAGLAGCAGLALSSDRGVDEAARVREVLDAFYRAVDAKDWAAVKATLDDDFEFFSDDTVAIGRDEFIKAMKDDDMAISRLEFSKLKVEAPEGSAIAWAKYHARIDFRLRGKPTSVATVETCVFRKRDQDRWRMVHNHASVRKLVTSAGAGR
jgi:ketosteroid isomerase-like protein